MDDEQALGGASPEPFDSGLADYLRAAALDGDLRVQGTLKESEWERTELVYLRGASGSEMGPYVRKTFPGERGRRLTGRGYELLFRAQREGRRFARLPRILLCSDQPDRLVVLMEYVRGRTLDEWIAGADECQRLAVARVAIPQLCEALSEMHCGMGEPVIHRDVKPSNVICTGDGQVPKATVLVDLGISRAFRPGVARDTLRLGTVGFAAPEQYGFRQTDVRTDVFAAGMTLAFCLLGREPTGEDLEGGFAGACGNKRLCSVARKATSFDPDDRYQTAEDMRRAVVAAFGGLDDGELEGEECGDVLEFCPNCGAILTIQQGFESNDGFWTCKACGQQLFGDGVYAGNRYPGVVWYCDECGALLNAQRGFDDMRDSWRCTKCGHVNPIAASEIDG